MTSLSRSTAPITLISASRSCGGTPFTSLSSTVPSPEIRGNDYPRDSGRSALRSLARSFGLLLQRLTRLPVLEALRAHLERDEDLDVRVQVDADFVVPDLADRSVEPHDLAVELEALLLEG